MVVKLLKPVPMINRVLDAGTCVDSEKIFMELIVSGRAVEVDVSSTCLPETSKNENSEEVHEATPEEKETTNEAVEAQPKKRGRKPKAE